MDEPELREILVRAGLLPGGALDLLRVREGRFRSALVRSGDGLVRFIKHCRTEGPQLELAGEIRFYRTVAPLLDDPALAAALPRRVGEVAEEALILEGHAEAASLDEALFARTPDPSLFSRLGRLLAALHDWNPPPTARPRGERIKVPLLAHDRVTPTRFSQRPASYGHFLTLLQGSPGLIERLAVLRASWRPERFIHGDMKLDNVLLVGDPASPAMKLVDWELSGVGDRYWDCAALLGSLYYLWVQHGLHPQEQSVMLPSEADISRCVVAFVEGYGHREPGRLVPSRALAWAGGWIVQRVYAGLGPGARLDRSELACLHLAQHLLADLKDGQTGGSLQRPLALAAAS